MKDDTPLSVKEDRLHQLNELVNKYALEANEKYLGKTVPVLLETISEKKDGMFSWIYRYNETCQC